MEVKVCKECWADIPVEESKEYTFKLSNYKKLSSHEKDYVVSDYICSEYCLEQWTMNELEGYEKAI